mmetsp:Transcript_25319/g.81912  ORF Transcript_25319/g.81912 Transcript_25319/m.81912 type:complete len:261 (+) Transcript_25319:2585-3367(+)
MRVELVNSARSFVGDRLEESRSNDRRRREGPRRVGQSLRLELVNSARSFVGDRLEESRSCDGRRREGPRRVGQLLWRELADSSRSFRGDRLEESRSSDRRRREGPRRDGHFLRVEVANSPSTALRKLGDPRIVSESSPAAFRQAMSRRRQISPAEAMASFLKQRQNRFRFRIGHRAAPPDLLLPPSWQQLQDLHLAFGVAGGTGDARALSLSRDPSRRLPRGCLCRAGPPGEEAGDEGQAPQHRACQSAREGIILISETV